MATETRSLEARVTNMEASFADVIKVLRVIVDKLDGHGEMLKSHGRIFKQPQ